MLQAKKKFFDPAQAERKNKGLSERQRSGKNFAERRQTTGEIFLPFANPKAYFILAGQKKECLLCTTNERMGNKFHLGTV